MKFIKGQTAWNKGLPSPWTSEMNRARAGIPNLKRRKRVQVACGQCGIVVERRPCFVKKHVFCSPECTATWRKTDLFKTEQSLRIKGKTSFEKNGMWKGGRSHLALRIRLSFEYRMWRTSIFKRDNFTCNECGVRGGYMHVHHKKSFKKIFDEFLGFYNQFSPTDDTDTLVRLSWSYPEFWKQDNGITLCRTCHYLIERKK